MDKKNSDTSSPSIKHEVIGISTVEPSGLAISPRIPASWVKLEIDPRALEFIIMKIGLSKSSLEIACNSFLTSSLASVQISITLL